MFAAGLIIAGFLIATSAGAGLNEFCKGNESCGPLDTYCKNGTCACNDNFAEVFDTCIPFVTPTISCKSKADCKSTLGRSSICKEEKCACKSFHHFHEGQCIKSRGLDEMCELNNQCYCGQNCSDKVECADGFCRCRPGLKQYRTKCVGDVIPKHHHQQPVRENSADLCSISTVVFLTSLLLLKSL